MHLELSESGQQSSTINEDREYSSMRREPLSIVSPAIDIEDSHRSTDGEARYVTWHSTVRDYRNQKHRKNVVFTTKHVISMRVVVRMKKKSPKMSMKTAAKTLVIAIHDSRDVPLQAYVLVVNTFSTVHILRTTCSSFSAKYIIPTWISKDHVLSRKSLFLLPFFISYEPIQSPPNRPAGSR